MTGIVGRLIAPRGHSTLIRGEGRYLDDLDIPGVRYAAFIRSPHARARIVRIDTALARRSGALMVLTATEIEGRVAPIHAPIGGADYYALPRPLLPTREVRFVGEPVAVVVADSKTAAVDAAELVQVDYEVLEPVIDVELALRPTAPRVHAEVEGNILFRGAQSFGDIAARFAEAEITLAKRFQTGRLTGIPLEPRGCIAIPDPSEDSLTIWAPSQAPHIMRTILAECLKMPEARLRIRVPHVGGGFGIKIHVYPEEVLVAFLARTLRIPVKWVQTRVEDLQASAHCREQTFELEIAARNNGEFLALRARVLSDNGAFALPPQGAVLQSATVRTANPPRSLPVPRLRVSVPRGGNEQESSRRLSRCGTTGRHICH